jgi:uncharacterized protein YndB with AHSA1/START domain
LTTGRYPSGRADHIFTDAFGSWQINGQWQYDPEPEHASEIEVRFTADGPEQTTVELEHRHLERLVDGRALRDGITGGGWTTLLERFAKAATPS